MNLTTNKYDGLNLLTAEGIFEEKDFRIIAEELESLPSEAEKFVLLDCAGLKKLIQSGVGFSTFVSHLLHIKSMNASITLIGCDEQAHRLFDLLKLDQVFQFSPTLDDAYLIMRESMKTPAVTPASA